MPSAIPRLLTSAIPVAVTGAATGWLLSTGRWSSWGVEVLAGTPTGQTSFADLKAILATSLCMQFDTDYTQCDPYGRPFTPYVVLPARILSWFGLNLTDTTAIGIGLAVIYVVTVGVLGLYLALGWRASTPVLLAAQLLLGLAAISAPAMLGIERGQIEILTLALSVGALLALSRRRPVAGLLGATAAVVAVATKFFAIGLFAPFVRRGRPNWAAIVAAIVSVAFLVLSWSALQQAATTARVDDPATSKAQFGSMTLVATLITGDPVGYIPGADVVEMWSRVKVIGWIVLAAVVVIAAIAIPRTVVTSLDAHPAPRALLLGGIGVVAVPYALGASHDYRMVFLLPALVGALVWSSRCRGASFWVASAIVLAIVISLTTGAAMVATPSGFLWPKAAMVVGDVALVFTVAIGGGLWIRGLVTRHD